MTSEVTAMIITAVVSVITCGGFFAFIEFLIRRKDDKKHKDIDDVKSLLNECLLSSTRCELNILMYHRPKDRLAILELAKKYFCELKGNSYMGILFKRWLDKNDIPTPPWFHE